MNNSLEAIAGALAILLPFAAALVTSRKPKANATLGNGIKPVIAPPQDSNITPGLLLAQDAQGMTLKLLSSQMETLSNDIRRRFDDMLIMMAEMRNGQDRRLAEVETQMAHLTQRVYTLEQRGEKLQ